MTGRPLGRQEPYTPGKENVLVASSAFVGCRRESGISQRARHGCAWGGRRQDGHWVPRQARIGQAGRHGRFGEGVPRLRAPSQSVRMLLSYSWPDASSEPSTLRL